MLVGDSVLMAWRQEEEVVTLVNSSKGCVDLVNLLSLVQRNCFMNLNPALKNALV